MLKKSLLIVILAILMVVPSIQVGAQDKTLAEVAAGDPNFSTLVSLVQAAGLADVLSSEGPFTVFAPNNDAFAKLPSFVVDYLTDPAHKDLLTQVLTYHVVSGSVMAADVTTMEADSMQMSAVGEAPVGTKLDVQVAEDGSVKVNDANVIATDVAASNGVIHVIDTVLIPPITLPEVTPAVVTGDIAIDGSSTVGPLAVAIADRFKTDGYGSNITIGISGTGGGFKAFCEELTIDIATASRAIKSSGDAASPDELEKCEANGRKAIPFRVGTDGIALVVNPQNTFATDLTTDEIKLLFSTATKWSDVRADFPAEDIIRYIPGTDSGTFDYFRTTFFPDAADPMLNAANLNQSEDDNVLVQGVEGNQYGVGFFGYAYYNENADKLKAVAIDGVLPTFDTVESSQYKLSRPLFLYSDPTILTEKPQAADFINYFLTNVQDVISTVGYFPASEYELNRSRLWYLVATGM